jgi:hypothetical protein
MDCHIAVCHCPTQDGTRFRVRTGDDAIRGETVKPTGFYSTWNIDFERVPLAGPVSLNGGRNEISYEVEEGQSGEGLLHLRSIEVTPTAAGARVDAGAKRAIAGRSSTQWLADHVYGVMFHWDAMVKPQSGSPKAFADQVRDLDVDKLAETVERAGGKYLIFTYHHSKPGSPAPLDIWEKRHPGWTTRRDLIADLIEALDKRGIDLMLYFASHITGKYASVPQDEFVDLNQTLVSAVGERYGTKLKGLWLDGWYQCDDAYPGMPYEDLYQSFKAGNPDRIVGVHSWIYPIVTEFQEYWTGESSGPGHPPTGEMITSGAGRGLRYHTLFGMEPAWIHDAEDQPIPAPHHTADALTEYFEKLREIGGAATVNLSCFEDGSVLPESMAIMEDVRRRVRGG